MQHKLRNTPRAVLTLAALAAGLAVTASVAAAQDGGGMDAGVSDAASTPDGGTGAVAHAGIGGREDLLDGARPDAAPWDGAYTADAEAPLDAATWDAGTPDAGPHDAGPPDAGLHDAASFAPAAAAEADVPWTTLLNELLFDRAERAEQAQRAAREARARRPSDPAPTTVVNTPRDVDVRVIGCAAQPELLGMALPDRRISAVGLMLLLAFFFTAIAALERARRPLAAGGLLPRLIGVAQVGLRLGAVLLCAMLASRLLPDWLRPALLLTLGGVALAIGVVAVVVVLPDLVAGLVLVTEQRLVPGSWITGEGFAGTLEHVGPRLATLRGEDGTALTIPNRQLLRSRVRIASRRWHEVEVQLVAPDGVPAARVRRAIADAVLSSPHVPPSPGLVITRDPEHPLRWRVAARLVDPRYAPEFSGQLLERVEEGLAGEEA